MAGKIQESEKLLANSVAQAEKELTALRDVAEGREIAGGLPEEWSLATLADIADWGSGGTPSRKNSDYYGGEIPWVKTGDLGPRYVTEATEYITEEAVKNSSAKYFPKGSVALAMYGATIGKTSILGIDATTNQACAVGNPIEGVTSTDYLYYFLKNEKDAFIAKGKGGAQPNISQALIKAHEIFLPPLAEQAVIAQTLDTLLAQVDNIKTRLDAIPKILKTFRQSVLAAAVSGKLTEEWRRENECGEWKKLRLDDVCDNSFYGPRFSKNDYNENGFPTIRTTDMTDRGEIRVTSETPRVEVAPDKIDLFKVRRGDLLITRTGSIGVMAIFKESFIAIPSAYLIRFRFLPMVDVQYIYYCLTSPEGKNQMGLGTTTTTQPNINAKKIREILLGVPPLKEQTEIVRRVEELFAFADQIEQQVKNAQGRVNNLTQSILAKAFRGELTAQWRAENPELISGENSAEALLAKIQEERDALKKKVKPKKKTALKKSVNKK